MLMVRSGNLWEHRAGWLGVGRGNLHLLRRGRLTVGGRDLHLLQRGGVVHRYRSDGFMSVVIRGIGGGRGGGDGRGCCGVSDQIDFFGCIRGPEVDGQNKVGCIDVAAVEQTGISRWSHTWGVNLNWEYHRTEEGEDLLDVQFFLGDGVFDNESDARR